MNKTEIQTDHLQAAAFQQELPKARFVTGFETRLDTQKGHHQGHLRADGNWSVMRKVRPASSTAAWGEMVISWTFYTGVFHLR